MSLASERISAGSWTLFWPTLRTTYKRLKSREAKKSTNFEILILKNYKNKKTY